MLWVIDRSLRDLIFFCNLQNCKKFLRILVSFLLNIFNQLPETYTKKNLHDFCIKFCKSYKNIFVRFFRGFIFSKK